MILYFSATGNTEFVAKELASRLNDECINLLERVKTNNTEAFTSDKAYIVCAPVYVGEMPRFMASFLEQISLNGNKDVYFIFTCGGYAGISGKLAESLMKKKNMTYKGHAELTMPNNYVINDHYSMTGNDEIEDRITKVYSQLDDIANVIKSNEELKSRHILFLEILATVPLNPVWSKFKFKDDKFYADDKCIGCKKCEKMCPLNNIKMLDSKPTWNNHCTHCMACIGNCPVEAINYGEITADKTPYNINKYEDFIGELRKNHY